MKYALNKGQLEFIKSKERQVGITSGLGGGKSFVLQLAFLLECINYPNGKHCYSSLSYRNMEDAAIPGFKRFLDDNEIESEWCASDYMFLINGNTQALFRSQDTAHNMRSVEIDSLFCDELAYWPEKNFKTLQGRLRGTAGRRIMRAATTPKGFNHFWEMFVKKQASHRKLIYTSSRDNKHLPDEYISDLEESYDSDLALQEIEGQFVNVGYGKIYYKWNQQVNMHSFELIPHLPLQAFMDFNVNPMTAVIAQVTDEELFVWDEVWLENSNTYAMRDFLLEKYGRGMQIIPDAAGNQRKSSATQTDHGILREAGFDVARVRNPARKDRFNCVNNLFEKGRIHVHPRCKKLAWDLSVFADDGAEGTGHISDCLGYGAWYHFPIRIRRILDDKPTIL